MKVPETNRNKQIPVGFPDVANALYLDAAEVSNAFTRDVVLYITPVADDAWIAVGDDPTAAAATAGNMFIPAGQTVTLGVERGNKITSTAALSATPAK